MGRERGLGNRVIALGFVAGVILAAPSAWAVSGEVGRTPACLHPTRTADAARSAHAKSVRTAESVLVSLIDAGTTAWNATLGGIMPAPEIVLKRFGRA